MAAAYFLIDILVHGTFILCFLVLASLSRIFGTAQKKKPLYRLLYAACFGFGAAGLVLAFAPAGGVWALSALLLDVVFLAVGLGVTHFYWDWLPREIKKG